MVLSLVLGIALFYYDVGIDILVRKEQISKTFTSDHLSVEASKANVTSKLAYLLFVLIA
jgi:hypothetical protein